MTVNLAEKYSPKVDERFKLKSLTEAGINRDYDWAGVSAIHVYDIPTVAMGNYTRTGTSRYGTPAELDNTKSDYLLTKDRSFTFAIDKASKEETMNVMDAGKALARQQDEVITPEIDAYRIAAIATAAVANGGSPTAAVLTTSTAYAAFLAMMEYFSDNKVPLSNIVTWVSPKFYTLIKQDTGFMVASEIAQNVKINGQVGQIDGAKIVRVPSSYLPVNTDWVGCNPMATVAADKLQDYKIHDNPPGINGSLVEGRVIYDAFVLKSKLKAVYTHKNL